MAAKTTVTTQVDGNTVTQVKKTIEVINPNQPKKRAIRKAKLRKQHIVGKLCLLLTIGCFTLGTTVLPEASTVGLLFLLPGVTLTFSKKVWQGVSKMKGYNVPGGYMGLVNGTYRLFSSDTEYWEYMLENEEV